MDRKDSVLKVSNLHVQINHKKIIRELSLSVAHQQFVGILGANGSGKSTLLKAIYQVIKPTSGMILFEDRELAMLSPIEKAQKMAVVGQFNSTNFDFTVSEYVMMGRYPHRKTFEQLTKQDENIVLDALKKMEMGDYINRRVSSLSGGEKQRIVIARALAQQPECLILDEPTNHLDIKHQLHLYKLLKELRLTTIAVIHDIAFAYNYCDVIYALKEGGILTYGPPKEVITPTLVRELYGVEVELIPSQRSNKVAVCYV